METTTIILFVLWIAAAVYFAAESFKKESEIGRLRFENERLQKTNAWIADTRNELLELLQKERKKLESKELELLSLKDKCYMRKGRAFVKYRDYIASEVLDSAVDLTAYYKLTKKK